MSSPQPSVSIITITYNDPSGLSRTFQSLLNVARRDIHEWIVVNGGQRSEVIDQICASDLPIKVISESDDGIYDAMNKGVRAATGDLLWFLNGGDSVAHESIVTTIRSYFSDTPCSWAYGDVQIVGRAIDGDRLWSRPILPFRRYALGGVPIPHQGAIFRRELVRDVGPYETDFGVGADQLFMLRASLIEQPRKLSATIAVFDGTGIGTERSLRTHFRDMKEARHRIGASSRLADICAFAFRLRGELSRAHARVRSLARGRHLRTTAAGGHR